MGSLQEQQSAAGLLRQCDELAMQRDVALAVCKALDEFQRDYGGRAWDPDGMPGNSLYREKLLALVRQARAAIAFAAT